MRLIKLNGNYANSKKWNYMLQFGRTGQKTNKTIRAEQTKWAVEFTKFFGPDRTPTPAEPGKIFGGYAWNENWFNDTKRNRICFKNEADYTVILLVMNSKT